MQAEERLSRQAMWEDEKIGGDLSEDHSKEPVQRKLRSGCRISERRRLEAEIEKDMMMSE